MRVKIRSIRRAGVSSSHSEKLSDRVEQVLAVFGHSIREVMVVLDDVNGDKGGPDDKVCRVQVRSTQGGAPIIADGRSDEYWDALNYALKRVRRQLAARNEAEATPTKFWARRTAMGMTMSMGAEG